MLWLDSFYWIRIMMRRMNFVWIAVTHARRAIWATRTIGVRWNAAWSKFTVSDCVFISNVFNVFCYLLIHLREGWFILRSMVNIREVIQTSLRYWFGVNCLLREIGTFLSTIIELLIVKFLIVLLKGSVSVQLFWNGIEHLNNIKSKS